MYNGVSKRVGLWEFGTMLKAINNADLNIFKRNIFKMSNINECPCGEKKSTPLKDGLLKDTFECCAKE